MYLILYTNFKFSKVPDTEEEERNEVKNTIQQTVSHFTSNANKVTTGTFIKPTAELLMTIFCNDFVFGQFLTPSETGAIKSFLNLIYIFTVAKQTQWW